MTLRRQCVSIWVSFHYFLTRTHLIDTMKAITLITVVLSAVAISSCCCQSQSVPPLRPMPKDLLSDTPVQTTPVKVIGYKDAK